MKTSSIFFISRFGTDRFGTARVAILDSRAKSCVTVSARRPGGRSVVVFPSWILEVAVADRDGVVARRCARSRAAHCVGAGQTESASAAKAEWQFTAVL